MRRELPALLADIQQCIGEIEQFTANQSLTDYQEDARTRRAVEREFIIIAEALLRISRISAELQARVEHVREISDFRNVLVHDYGEVDDEHVWRIIVESVPLLKQQIDQWADELDRS